MARPQNAVLGLAVSIFLPLAQFFSGAVMAVVTLAGGLRTALVTGALAAGVLMVIASIISAPLLETFLNAAATWGPIALLAGLARSTRSLTLALQVSVILALLGTLVFYAVVADPEAFWESVLGEIAALSRDLGLVQQADQLTAQMDLIVPQMTALCVIVLWSVLASVLAIGYWAYQKLPGQAGVFGRFCDLNFGRVIATTMAVGSTTALLVDWPWLENFAFVAFVIFWLQGLAIVHWLHTDGPLPSLAVVVIYAMLPLLNALLLTGLAVLGFTDAWFDFRSRGRRNDAG